MQPCGARSVLSSSQVWRMLFIFPPKSKTNAPQKVHLDAMRSHTAFISLIKRPRISPLTMFARRQGARTLHNHMASSCCCDDIYLRLAGIDFRDTAALTGVMLLQ